MKGLDGRVAIAVRNAVWTACDGDNLTGLIYDMLGNLEAISEGQPDKSTPRWWREQRPLRRVG